MPAPVVDPSAARDRVIRVFVSSTFADMQAERNYLVKFTFPALRKLCVSRGITWGQVDLRWGVTDEEKAEGQVLPRCLEEIRRCRPYFIGLLGERYGWIPDAVAPELIEREPWLAEHVRERKSVTELEILHGVLNNTQMAGHAFFYFRDPAYRESLPLEKPANVTADVADGAEKLRRLKTRIRQSGLPVHENYRDPQALGERVLADLTAVIDQLFPAGTEPDPLDREAADHEAYAKSRAVVTLASGQTHGVYIGRQAYLSRLDANAAGAGDQPLVVLGESGSGKSALLANWVLQYRAAHPESLVLEHYIGATPYSADWVAMLRRLMGEFKRRLGLTQEIPDQPDALRSAFPNWLHMAAAKGRVVLVLDALNQLEDRDGAPDLLWLPPVMPENVRLIVSTLPGRPHDEVKKRDWPTLTVEPLTPEERRHLIEQYLGQRAKRLSRERVERIATAPQAANPLYLRVLLDELCQLGEHERLGAAIDDYLQAASPYELYEKVIARWDQDYGQELPIVRNTLMLLWAARRGLSEIELLDALGDGNGPLPRAVWSPLYLAMSDALVSRGGLLTFAHDFFRTAARNAYLPTLAHQAQTHERLADYFEQEPAGPRRTDELPWQLAAAAAWERLYSLLADRSFFNEAWAQNQFEVKAYWAQIENSSELRMLEAYRTLIEHPDADSVHAWHLGFLLDDNGHPVEALRIRTLLVEHFRTAGNLYGLQIALNGQAMILKVRGDLDGAMALSTEAEQVSRQLGNLDGLQHALGNKANIVCLRGDLDRAMALYKEAERISRQLRDPDSLSTVLGGQASILESRGDLDEAMALHKEAERICRQLGNLDGLQHVLGKKAKTAYSRGDYEGAMALHKEAERICRQLGKLNGLSQSLGNQASILYSRGDLEGAMVLSREAERICRQLGNLEDLQGILGNQALLLKSRGDLAGAMALLEEAERICRQLGKLDDLQGTLGNQGLIFEARGDLERAMTLYMEKERICRQLENLNGLQGALGNQANILYSRGDLDRAMALMKEQEHICRQLGNLDGLQIALGNRALILKEHGDLVGAMTLHEEEEQICRQLGNLEGLQASLVNQAIILSARGDLDGALNLYKEAERICRQLGAIEGLARSLANQASVLSKMKQPRAGLPLVEEAYRLATTHDYVVLAKHIEPILRIVRQAARGG